jgi:hypothetical protein
LPSALLIVVVVVLPAAATPAAAAAAAAAARPLRLAPPPVRLVHVRVRVGRALRLGQSLRQPCRPARHALAQQVAHVAALGGRLLLSAAKRLEAPAGAAVADSWEIRAAAWFCGCCCCWCSASRGHDAQAGLRGRGRGRLVVSLLLSLLLLLALAPPGRERRERRRRRHPFVALGLLRRVRGWRLRLLLRLLLGGLAVAQLNAGQQAGHGWARRAERGWREQRNFSCVRARATVCLSSSNGRCRCEVGRFEAWLCRVIGVWCCSTAQC